jgi:hypothetical protein
MNVFELDRVMIEEYAAFSRSFTKIRAADIREPRRLGGHPVVTVLYSAKEG